MVHGRSLSWQNRYLKTNIYGTWPLAFLAKSIPQDQYTWFMAARFLGKIDTPKTNIHGIWPLDFLVKSIPLNIHGTWPLAFVAS